MMKKIVFLTGTRADFGKLKSLIEITSHSNEYQVHIFATGMHMNPKYGRTVDEIIKCGYKNIFLYYNHNDYDTMDTILSKTIEGFSHYVKDIKPDLIVLHGDRVEALAGAIVGSLNNIFTAHIEGGEISGTIDESIRHSISKLAHIHLVSNEQAKKRLIQMGENKKTIFVIGSPDIDILCSDKIPDLNFIKEYYNIDFDNYAILLFHPVTTEFDFVSVQSKNLVDAVILSKENYIVVYPNNDIGTDFIFIEYKKLKNNKNFMIFPSIRFEYFLVLLKNAKFIIGNSSAGIREAPYFGTPTINIGSRQHNRVLDKNIINCSYEVCDILKAIEKSQTLSLNRVTHFGEGKSAQLFLDILNSAELWTNGKQKYFEDL